jgi:4-amino-4-deoxy-L-arabinose transferase-like glycosyltransferase
MIDTNRRPLMVHRRELLIVSLMTVIGGLIRLGSPSKLGLVHFDEGIYALAGLWPISPKGFWGIDPTVIAYAPGGYPFLIGLASFILGPGDLTPILVSILMGTLTIPLAAWLAWRTFGPTSGAIVATLAAFSGIHIAFSRMALTDVSFLFFFLLAIGLGQRFLERPGILNTIGLGIGVGLAQWFKYHGWLAGAIVALAAVVNAIRDPAERRPKRLAAIWGQGACAGLIAFAVFWPWFSFVESHGGYADLLRHHASYLKGVPSWFVNLQAQLDQGAAFGGLAGGVAVFLVLCLLGEPWKRRRFGPAVAILGLLSQITFGGLWGWAIGLSVSPILLRFGKAGRVPVALWWLVLSLLTPLYHPYLRLWLPLEACGWLMLGYLLSGLIAQEIQPDPALSYRPVATWIPGSVLAILGFFVWLTPGLSGSILNVEGGTRNAPSDSLRAACRRIKADLPNGMTRLRFLGRPPITFYLGTAGVALSTQANPGDLLKPGGSADWALVDDAMLRQEPDHSKIKARLFESWEIVREYPTTLNLPTLLDIDPGAASRPLKPSDLECPLWLLRPRSQGAPR